MSEEHQVHTGLRINRKYRGRLVPDHHGERTRDVHRNQEGKTLPLLLRNLLAAQNVDKVDDRQNQREDTDDVCKARDGQNIVVEQQIEHTAEREEERDEECNCLFPLSRRQRVVRLHAERSERALFENQIDNTAESADDAEDEEGHLIARDQRNAADHNRAHGADVREHIDDRERTVAPLVALFIELAKQGIQRAACDCAVHIADHAVENQAEHADIRNRKRKIVHGRRNRTEAIGSPVAEDTVRHVGADCAENRAESNVQRDKLGCLELREPQTLRGGRIEIVDENRAEAVARDASHHVLETHNADAKGVTDKAGLVLQLLNFRLPRLLPLCRCCNRFHNQNLLFRFRVTKPNIACTFRLPFSLSFLLLSPLFYAVNLSFLHNLITFSSIFKVFGAISAIFL